MRTAAVTLILAALPFAGPTGQAPAPPAEASAPAALVREWIERLNALSDAPETLDRFVALHADDALLTAGPTPDQRGTATYRGPSGIRAWAARLAARETRRVYRLETETARETTATLFHETPGPWGGPAVAVQIVGTYTDDASGTRYVVPGALFLQIADGRIRRARLYLGDGERAEVEPEPTRRRP
ncbi:MAG: nuclear transport factor 2 family protein [Vicinamibacterales bacterium]